MIECVAMKNTVLLIHKKREDIEAIIKEFDECYLYLYQEIDKKSPFIIKIEKSRKNNRNVIGNGIRQINKDFPNHNIVLVNDLASIIDIKKIVEETEQSKEIIIAQNTSYTNASKKKQIGIKIITKLLN